MFISCKRRGRGSCSLITENSCVELEISYKSDQLVVSSESIRLACKNADDKNVEVCLLRGTESLIISNNLGLTNFNQCSETNSNTSTN